jgi:hypothetical protein
LGGEQSGNDRHTRSGEVARCEIYLECGNQDSFNLHEATEFLHQVLWNKKVPHEYHLVDGADHLGRTLRPRMIEGFAFLERALHPPPVGSVAEDLKKRLAPLKQGSSRSYFVRSQYDASLPCGLRKLTVGRPFGS